METPHAGFVWMCRMGTHPSGPAMLAINTAISLQEWLEQHSQALGATVLKRFGLKLPFLFKVGQKQAPVVRPEVYFTHAAAPYVQTVKHTLNTGLVCGDSTVHSISP